MSVALRKSGSRAGWPPGAAGGPLSYFRTSEVRVRPEPLMVDVRHTNVTHRRPASAVAGLLIVAAVGGCAHGARPGAGPQAQSGLPDPLATSEQWTQADAITRVVHLGSNKRTLTVVAVIGGCKTAELLSQETPAVIRLTVRINFRRPAGEACPAYAEITSVQTTLRATLNGRKIVDATTGKLLVVADTRP